MTLKIDMNDEQVVKSLNRKMKKLQPIMKKALTDVGIEIIKEARNRVPIKTGALQRSLDYTISTKGGKQVILSVGSGLTGGTKIKYALIQEQGGQAGRGGSVRIKPTWYMRNSMRVIKSKLNAIFNRHLKRGLK